MSPRSATLACAVVGLLLPLATPRETAAQPAPVLIGAVVHVDDGDTIDVRIGERVERVRYIGIDAPEIAHEPGGGRPGRGGAPGGRGAARLNAALVGGRAVRLELDVEARDRYGRLLAYVWAGETMINAELLRRGYARTLPIAPNLRYASRFATLEAEARAERRGLWGDPEAWDSGGGQGPALGVERTTAITIVRWRLVPRSDRRPKHLHVTSRARVGHVVHVRASLPERHGARIAALGQHRDPPRAFRAQPPLGVGDKRARHAAAAPFR